MQSNKRYKKNFDIYKKNITYGISEAINIVKKMHFCNFDESIDVSIHIRKMTMSTSFKFNILFPYGNGKKNTILLLINKGDNNIYLKKKYKVDFIGGEDTINDIKNKKDRLNYQYIITTPKMLSNLKHISFILNKKKLMPSYEKGTISKDISQAVKSLHKGLQHIKPDKFGSMHMSIGRVSFKHKYIYHNFITLIQALSKFISMKNSYIQIVLSTTMSPGIKINTDDIIK